MPVWNPWHGCHKFSDGCLNCYMYRRDESVGRDPSIIAKTHDYNLPLQKTRNGTWKLQPTGTVFTGMTTDFFLEEADEWRDECWQMMKQRSDLFFIIVTKRIHRAADCFPKDWGSGYPNVGISCTCENQKIADERLPVFLKLPIRYRVLGSEPMLEELNVERYLKDGKIDYVFVGGESGEKARPCHYDWILSMRNQCMRNNVSFHFKQTGAVFVKDGKVFHIERKMQEIQAEKAGIDFIRK